MVKTNPFRPHGSGIRGLTNVADPTSLRTITQNEARFGRLFGELQPVEFAVEDLLKLADAINGDDAIQDGPDPEESHIPAAYTYLGQFIDHDLTFDPSTFAQQKSDPLAVEDFRTPKFDLDNLYGRGPDDQPYLYDGLKLQMGDQLTNAQRNPGARDLPRVQPNGKGARRAIIGDPRNDENVIVSQLHGMFLRFHNRLVDLSPQSSFDDIATQVRWHYQWIVLHDFLPRIVEEKVLDQISPAISDPSKSFQTHPPKLLIYTERFKNTFMPVEFSVAAYRLGHSMVRPAYRVNENVPPLPIFNAANPKSGLNAFGEFPKNWAIDWQRFVDLGLRHGPETDQDRVQLAYKIDTSIVDPLSKLPASVAGDEAARDPRLFKLAFRNLLRSVKLKLPSGQAVAQKLQAKVLDDGEILVGAAANNTKEADGARSITAVSGGFGNKCPLWVYVLAEARNNFFTSKRAVLGAVGARIVAEVFLALLLRDRLSVLHAGNDWKPSLGKNGKFELADLLLAALQ